MVKHGHGMSGSFSDPLTLQNASHAALWPAGQASRRGEGREGGTPLTRFTKKSLSVIPRIEPLSVKGSELRVNERGNRK